MSNRPLDPRLRLLLITPGLDEHPGFLETIEAALVGGLRAVQLRDKQTSASRLLDVAQALRKLTARHGALLLINGRADVAAACQADGVHLGAREMPPGAARKLLGPAAWIGYSAHLGDRAPSWREADFVTLSPVFHSPGKGEPVGAAALAQFIGGAGVPVVALGGIDVASAGPALLAGASGIAVIREIFAAPNPAHSAQRLCAIVQERFDGATSGS